MCGGEFGVMEVVERVVSPDGEVMGRSDGWWWWLGVDMVCQCWSFGVDGRLAGCESELLCLCFVCE